MDLIEEDIQDLLETGMRNADTSLASLSNERLIDRLVEVQFPSPKSILIVRCGGHSSVLHYPTLKPSSSP